MSSNSSISYSGLVVTKIVGVAISVSIIPAILFFFRFYVKYDNKPKTMSYEHRKMVPLDWLVVTEVPFFILVLAILPIPLGGKLPTSIDTKSTLDIKILAASSDIGSLVLSVFVAFIPNYLLCLTVNRLCRCHFSLIFCSLVYGNGTYLKNIYMVLPVALLGGIAILFNILQWVFQTTNKHAKTPYPFALVSASIHISIILGILVTMLSTRPWNSLRNKKQRRWAVSRLVCSSGAIMLGFNIPKLVLKAKHQESEINTLTVVLRILEAFSDAFLLWHPEFTFRRKIYIPYANSFSTDTPVSPRYRLSQDSFARSTSAILFYEGDTNRACKAMGCESVTPPLPTRTGGRERIKSLPCNSLERSPNNYELPERNVKSSLGFRILEYEK